MAEASVSHLVETRSAHHPAATNAITMLRAAICIIVATCSIPLHQHLTGPAQRSIACVIHRFGGSRAPKSPKRDAYEAIPNQVTALQISRYAQKGNQASRVAAPNLTYPYQRSSRQRSLRRSLMRRSAHPSPFQAGKLCKP